jgi:hypothetical protein
MVAQLGYRPRWKCGYCENRVEKLKHVCIKTGSGQFQLSVCEQCEDYAPLELAKKGEKSHLTIPGFSTSYTTQETIPVADKPKPVQSPIKPAKPVAPKLTVLKAGSTGGDKKRKQYSVSNCPSGFLGVTEAAKLLGAEVTKFRTRRLAGKFIEGRHFQVLFNHSKTIYVYDVKAILEDKIPMGIDDKARNYRYSEDWDSVPSGEFPEGFASIRETAKLIGCGKDTIFKAIKRGALVRDVDYKLWIHKGQKYVLCNVEKARDGNLLVRERTSVMLNSCRKKKDPIPANPTLIIAQDAQFPDNWVLLTDACNALEVDRGVMFARMKRQWMVYGEQFLYIQKGAKSRFFLVDIDEIKKDKELMGSMIEATKLCKRRKGKKNA